MLGLVPPPHFASLSTSSFFIHLQVTPDAFLWCSACTSFVKGSLLKGLPYLGRGEILTMSDERIIETRTPSPACTLPAIIVLRLLAVRALAVGWNAPSKL